MTDTFTPRTPSNAPTRRAGKKKGRATESERDGERVEARRCIARVRVPPERKF